MRNDKPLNQAFKSLSTFATNGGVCDLFHFVVVVAVVIVVVAAVVGRRR